MSKLGNAFYLKGQHEKSLEIFERLLTVQKETLDDDPLIAETFNSIGLAYDGLGKYDKAIEYHKRALDIRIMLLGSQHLTVGISHHNIASVEKSKKEYEKAVATWSKALTIFKSTIGEDSLKVG
mmetsp:Transcript_12359/g.10660  ORF Transcript_12359/g.10660 Transcript_12359/m.10660 type:complete len:124 (+) Transcript_12359:106-477(+)